MQYNINYKKLQIFMLIDLFLSFQTNYLFPLTWHWLFTKNGYNIIAKQKSSFYT